MSTYKSIHYINTELRGYKFTRQKQTEKKLPKLVIKINSLSHVQYLRTRT